MKTIYKIIPIEYLERGQYQPRQYFDEAALSDLANSIRAQGLIEPLIVRETQSGRYEIIAGERRWRAATQAGLTEVPCLIGNYSNEEAAAITVIENIQRQDLNLLEEAHGYQRLQHEFHFNQDEIAALVGKSRSHITNILRLLTLCEAVQEKLKTNQLSLGHARTLVGLAPQHQLFFAKQVDKEGWSVRRLENEVRKIKLSREGSSPPPNHQLNYLQDKLAEHMGAPVQIVNDAAQGGWLKIKFFDNDTLSGLLERLGLPCDEV